MATSAIDPSPSGLRRVAPNRRRRWRVATIGVLAGLTLLAVPPLLGLQAPASATTLAITNLRVTVVSATSFSVTVASLGTGWRYRLYASTNKPDVYYDNLSTTPYRSNLSDSPKMTLTNLPYSSSPYWFRVQALMGFRHHTSDIHSLGLRPAMPTALRAAKTAKGAISLTWSGTAGGSTVQQATNATFGTGLRTYPIRGTGRQFTPYGLASGTTYWFRVRAINMSTASAYSTPVQATASSRDHRLRAMTFNILRLSADGTRADGEAVAPWSKRRIQAANYITSAAPDVIGVQEGSSWVGAPRGQRQVDSLVSALRGSYALARTEIPPSEPGYFRTGRYVLYKTSTYAAVGSGGHWNLGTLPDGQRWAAYQVLRSRSSGATFLFVSPHLYSGGGAIGDRARLAETTSMITQASTYAAAKGGLPIVYAGDFNSHERHPLDGPATAARTAHLADGLLVAQSLRNQRYNSANRYLRTPPASGLSLDHIYVAPGVGVSAWRQVLSLQDGRFLGVIPSDHNPVVADLVIPY